MEEEEPLLLPKPVIHRRFLPKVRERWARIVKALGRPSSRLHLRKASFRLAVCMQKASNYLRRKPKGKPQSTNSSIHVIGDRGMLHSAHHHSCDDHEEGVSESLAFLHLQNHSCEDHDEINSRTTHAPYVNPLRSHKKGQSTNNHMMLSFNPKKHAHMAYIGDYWLKRRKRRWHCRIDGTSTVLNQHKDGVPRDVPKGCVGVYVGVEHKRFIVPILHLNHPLFASLLECMNEDSGVSQTGPLWIPCDVSKFQTLHSQVKQGSKKYSLKYWL